MLAQRDTSSKGGQVVVLALDRTLGRNHQWLMSLLAALAVLAVVAMLAPGPAFGGWLASSRIAEDGGASQVVMDAQGNATAVWEDYAEVFADERPVATGLWQKPVRLSVGAQRAQGVRLAIDGRGNAVAVWEAGGLVQASERPAASGVWQAPVELSNLKPNELCEDDPERRPLPQVALDPRGDAVVVWQVCVGGGEDPEIITQASTRPAASGTWQKPVTISRPDREAVNPQVAVDPQGNVVALWLGDEDAVAAVGSATSGIWQTPVAITNRSAGEAFSPSLAVDAHGEAIAGWVLITSHYEPNIGEEKLFQVASGSAATGVWQAPVQLSTSTVYRAGGSSVAVDPRGDAVAVWDSEERGTIQGALRPSTTDIWQAPADISEPKAEAGVPVAAIDRLGDALAIWGRSWCGYCGEGIQASMSPAGSGTWEIPADISTNGRVREAPVVAFDPRGNAVALWAGEEPLVEGNYYENPNPPVITPPLITTVTPQDGPAAGGTQVTITGSNFSEVAAVTFGSTEATSFTVNSEDSITAVAPAGTGTVNVTISTPVGLSATSPADQFTYIAEPQRGHRRDEHYRRFDMRRWFWLANRVGDRARGR